MEKDAKVVDAHVDAAEQAKWGTRQMGPPAAPAAHPENQRAALWTLRGDDERPPYVLDFQPVSRPAGSPMESILDYFNSWAKKAEDLAQNIWHNLKAAPSMTEAAMGKLSLSAKAFTEGGFESLYRRTFHTDPNERLKKTFACYLSTAAGPVAGTLYISTANVAFCSDRPLSFRAPSGQETWSYYKVMIPLGKIANVSPTTSGGNPAQKFIHVVTVDGHEFWFMGFVNFEKAAEHLLDAVADYAAAAAAGGAQQPGIAQSVGV
ncbi:GEM-like protein 5 [Zingiber officinale]|uniref:GEM-like protein 5 n=1 Tax=Zingiber officinale TaxID=94328 RepID=UPI001C4C025B|nr:GEM-like protein 5 [Zingiber officinale]